MLSPTDLQTLTNELLSAPSPSEAAALFVRRIDVRALSEEAALQGIASVAHMFAEVDNGNQYRSQQFTSLAQIRYYHAWGWE